MSPTEEEVRSWEFESNLLPEAEPMAVQDIGDSLVIREGGVFLLTDGDGQVARGNRNGHGLYYRDMRYVSGYELTFANTRPIVLLSTAELGYASEQVMTNPAMVDSDGKRIPRGALHLVRTRVVDGGVAERLQVHNHSTTSISIELQYRLAADFADIFEVRGWEAERRGETRAPGFENGCLSLWSAGCDQVHRQTRISFSPQPDSLVGDPDLAFAIYELKLAPQEAREIELGISIDEVNSPGSDGEAMSAIDRRYKQWLERTTSIETGNDFFDAIMARSLADIRMLWTEEASGSYPAAGTPWYDALFGRDSCIVAMQMLAYKPEIARDVLKRLASEQGTKNDAWRDEEPGKIPHELRHGELTRSGELPFSPYYGSIDSTPLFLMLAGEYLRWTGDMKLLESLKPHLVAAFDWVVQSGDTNGDGYIDYEKRSIKGLVNQGWKDSAEAVVHADGSLADPPVTLVEVQGYAYAALTRLAEAMDLTPGVMTGPEELREKLNKDFWIESEGCYAMALDGRGASTECVTSNGGHVLFAGAAEPEKARRSARRLLQPDMFSGWGVRTLSRGSPRYNPEGYHMGTVWPHDNSIFAMGLKRYDLTEELNIVATALFRAAKTFRFYRLPELFGGSPMSPFQTPVPYPVACRPQAWAAGSIPLIAQAFLGLCPDAVQKRLYIVDPQLPPFLQRARVKGLRVAGAEVDLLFERRGTETATEVEAVRGDLAVETVGEWPEYLR